MYKEHKMVGLISLHNCDFFFLLAVSSNEHNTVENKNQLLSIVLNAMLSSNHFFNILPQKVVGYYIIPSESLCACPSVRI